MSPDPAASSILAKAFSLAGGLLFAASLAMLAVVFTGRFADDAGPWSFSAGWLPAFVNFELFTTFATHHSVFARSGLKAWIHRVAPPVLERSIYVWVASLLLVAVCWFWQPVPGRLWAVEGPLRLWLNGVQIAGVLLSLVGAGGLDTLSLAGVRQVFEAPGSSRTTQLDDRGVFALVRHPIYLGWLLTFWPTPVMNGTRLSFALTSCAYLVIAIPFEERDLRQTFGAAYDAYARKVRWRLIPWVY